MSSNSTFFDYITSISQTKIDLMKTPEDEKSYNQYMVNRGLSNYQDTVLYANEMNMRYDLDNRLQYSYLINTIRSRKRRSSKWFKLVKNEDLNSVMEYYGYNREKAQITLNILTKEQLNIIKQKLETGGVNK